MGIKIETINKVLKFRIYDKRVGFIYKKVDVIFNDYGIKGFKPLCGNYRAFNTNNYGIEVSTGMKDKLGNDIYLGDIIIYDDKTFFIDYDLAAMTFIYSDNVNDEKLHCLSGLEIEIIGDIHTSIDLFK